MELKVIGVTWVMTHLLIPAKGQTWQEHDGHCYTVLTTQRNFSDSRAACQKIGSNLIELEDMSELDYARTLINGTSDQFWVGLDYDQTKKDFYWTSDKSIPLVSMWFPSEPNFSGYNVRLATAMQATGAATGSVYYLADNPATSSYQAMCEKSVKYLNYNSYQLVTVSSKNRCPSAPYQPRSKLECAVKCSNDKSCNGFQFNDTTRNCTDYTFSSSCPARQTALLTMYVLATARC